MMHYFYDYGPMSYDNWWYGLIMMAFWLIVVIIIAIVVSRALKGHGNHWGQTRDPLDIIKERYAKGEISKQEYDRLKKDLK